MKSDMVAAESLFAHLQKDDVSGADILEYEELCKQTWAFAELKSSRNFDPAMHKFGTYLGAAFNFIDQNIFGGKLPITLTDNTPNHPTLKPASESKQIDYPKPDGKLSFEKSFSVFLSNTNSRGKPTRSFKTRRCIHSY